MQSAAERKKNRDRISQARKRQREKDLIASLQQQVVELQKRLGDEPIAISPSVGSSSQNTTASLLPYASHYDARPDARARSDYASNANAYNLLSTSVFSNRPYANEDSIAQSRLPPATSGLDNNLFASRPEDSGKPAASPPQQDGSIQTTPYALGARSPAESDSHMLSINSNDLQSLLDKPEWLRLPCWSPCLAADMSDLTLWMDGSTEDMIRELDASPAEIDALPLEPQVLDLLFGSSSNKLANCIAEKSRYTLAQTPERMAILWNVYLYLHWLLSPSIRTFSIVPNYLRPTTLQLTSPHPRFFDLLVWPTMRDNVIRRQAVYGKAIFTWAGLLACTLRIRNPLKPPPIVRENDGKPYFSPAFRAKIENLQDWGIIESFGIQFPDLVRGLGDDVVIHEDELVKWTGICHKEVHRDVEKCVRL